METIKRISFPDGSIYGITMDPESLFDFVSDDDDSTSQTKYINVPKLQSSDTNRSILNKISNMFKNVRYLYEFTNNINNKISGSGQTDGTHSHTVDQLPVSNVQINSSSNIPTSALVYQMNENLKLLQNSFGVKIKMEILNNPAKDTIIPSKCKNIISILCKPLSNDGSGNVFLKNSPEGMRISWSLFTTLPSKYNVIILYTD